jgi:membrane protein implicated in regulation of membrane protease activity
VILAHRRPAGDRTMLILLAIVLLVVLPSSSHGVVLLVLVPLSVLELIGWNQTVKHKRRMVGAHTLIGRDTVVVTPCEPDGQVRLDGEIWAARCDAGAASGESVRVVDRDGLTLIVSLPTPP